MNFNRQQGLSWADWIRIPANKILSEQYPHEARKKYMEEEAELVEQYIIQERMRVDSIKRQHAFHQQLRNIVSENQDNTITSVGNVAGVSGTGGAATSGGGGYSIGKGIGKYAVGTYLTSIQDGLQQVATQVLAGDEGFEIFTVQ